MRLQTQVIILTFSPALAIIVIAICLQISLVNNKKGQIFDSILTYLNNNQLDQHNAIFSPLQNLMQMKLQQTAIQIMAVAHVHESVTSGLDLYVLNKNFVPPIANDVELHSNNSNPDVITMFNDNQNYLDVWTYENTTNWTQLTNQQQQHIINDSYYGALTHSIIAANSKMNTSDCAFVIQQMSIVYISDGLQTQTPPMKITSNNYSVQYQTNSYSQFCVQNNYTSTNDNRCNAYVQIAQSSSSLDLLLYPLNISNNNADQLSYMSQYIGLKMNTFTELFKTKITVDKIQKFLKIQTSQLNLALFVSSSLELLYTSGYSDQLWIQSVTSQISESFQQLGAQGTISSQEFDSLFTYFSNFQNNPNLVHSNFTMNQSTFYTILSPISICQKLNRTAQCEPDTFYILVDTISQQQVFAATSAQQQRVTYVTFITYLVSLVILIGALIITIIYSLRYSRMVEEPIEKIIFILSFIDSSYLQVQLKQEQLNSAEKFNQKRGNISQTQQQLRSLSKNASSNATQGRQNKNGSLKTDRELQYRVESQFQQVFDKIVTNQDMVILKETVIFLFELIKQANSEYLLGNRDLSLLKMVEANVIYEKVGNLNAQATCTFNIANLHFLRGRYYEAIWHYQLSLNFIDRLLIEEEDPENNTETTNMSQRRRTSTFQQYYWFKFTGITEPNQDLKSAEHKNLRKESKLQDRTSNTTRLFYKKFDRMVALFITLFKRVEIENGLQDLFDLRKMLADLQEFNAKYLSPCECRQILILDHRILLDIQTNHFQQAQVLLRTYARLCNVPSRMRGEGGLQPVQKHFISFQKNTSQLLQDSIVEVSKSKQLLQNNDSITLQTDNNDDLNQSLAPFMHNQKAFPANKKVKCKSKYYHKSRIAYIQKYCYLQALYYYNIGKLQKALATMILWSQESRLYDRYIMRLMEQLGGKIVRSQQFNFSGRIKCKDRSFVSVIVGALGQQELQRSATALENILKNQKLLPENALIQFFSSPKKTKLTPVMSIASMQQRWRFIVTMLEAQQSNLKVLTKNRENFLLILAPLQTKIQLQRRNHVVIYISQSEIEQKNFNGVHNFLQSRPDTTFIHFQPKYKTHYSLIPVRRETAISDDLREEEILIFERPEHEQEYLKKKLQSDLQNFVRAKSENDLKHALQLLFEVEDGEHPILIENF